MLRKYRCRLYPLIKTVPRTTINTLTFDRGHAIMISALQ